MPESQLKRMQWLALKGVINRMIQVIGRKWVADISHMNPDLMGASCFEMDFKKRMTVPDIQSLVVSNSRFSSFKIYMTFYHRIIDTGNRC